MGIAPPPPPQRQQQQHLALAAQLDGRKKGQGMTGWRAWSVFFAVDYSVQVVSDALYSASRGCDAHYF